MSPDIVFLVFGEDDTDRRALINLIKAIAPTTARFDVIAIRKPIVFPKNTATVKRMKNIQEIAAFSKGYKSKYQRVIIVAHRDCDVIEPGHVSISASLETELKEAGVDFPVAATPAWEIETWWMLFPDMIASYRSCWRKVDYGASHVGRFENSKERLIRDLRPSIENRTRCRDYTESDGIAISEKIRLNRTQLNNISARSDSFNMFRSKLNAIFR